MSKKSLQIAGMRADENKPAKKPLRQSASSADNPLFDRIVTILEQARGNVVRSVNTNMVLAYWLIGREIVHDLQDGEERAACRGAARLRPCGDSLSIHAGVDEQRPYMTFRHFGNSLSPFEGLRQSA